MDVLGERLVASTTSLSLSTNWDEYVTICRWSSRSLASAASAWWWLPGLLTGSKVTALSMQIFCVYELNLSLPCQHQSVVASGWQTLGPVSSHCCRAHML